MVADDGCAQLAAGLVGNGTLKTLVLDENGVGEYGCAALAKAHGVVFHAKTHSKADFPRAKPASGAPYK